MRSAEFSRSGAVGWSGCPDVLRSWVLESCNRMAAELGPEHLGAYLHGSLASGSFHAPKSDVDLLFVVAHGLEPEVRRRFARTAAESNANRPIVGSLECSVVRRATLRARTHPAPVESRFSEGMTSDILDDRLDWRFLTTRGQPDLDGPPVSEVFSPFDRQDFLDAVRRDREWILDGENLLATPYYGILNVARSIWIAESRSPRPLRARVRPPRRS